MATTPAPIRGVASTSADMVTGPPHVTTAVPVSMGGLPLAYLAMQPNLPQIPNFCGGDERNGETLENWVDQFQAVASMLGGTSSSNLPTLQQPEWECEVLLPIPVQKGDDA